MRTINQRIYEAADKHGFEVISIASTENMTIAHCKKEPNTFFKITTETDSEVSKIEKAMVDSYFKAKE
jgi:isopenicillin N synthase-like dioxygenase